MPSSGAGSAAQASTSTGAPGATGTTGGAGVTAPPALIQIHEAIWAGDRIRFKPYIYAGGHGKWNDAGYDCSGSVSFVLHAAGLLKVSMDSSEFESWGRRGLGQWITVYTNPATPSSRSPASASIPRPCWRPVMTDAAGFMARHPAGL